MKYLASLLAAAILICSAAESFNLYAFISDSPPVSPTVEPYSPKQQNLIGTVTVVDAPGGKVAVKTDAGTMAIFSTNSKTSVRRVPPGQTSLANAETISLSDIKIGDRVLVTGGAADAQMPVARIIVMASEAIAAKRGQDQDAWQTRSTGGRVTAIDQNKREITVQPRGANGLEAITVMVPAGAKISHFAPGSLRPADARPANLADIRVGDQIRVLGNRSSNGSTMTAEEIISGSVVRASGTITDINTSANEITVKNEQTGQTFTIVLGKNSAIKRIPAEVAQDLIKQREQRQQQRQTRAETTSAQAENQLGQRNRGNAGRRSGGFQQLLDAQPAITIGDLKKGDAVMITGTQGADAVHLTAASGIVGDSALMQLFQRLQGGRNRNMSPGLPGNTAGGNGGNNPPDDDHP